MNDYREKRITIIGIGKVGYALLNKLLDNDYNLYSAVEKSLNIYKKIKREQKKIILYKEIKKEIIFDSDVIIIAVKDDEIENICKILKGFRINLQNKIIFHTSGVLSSGVISKYLKNETNSGSFQPVQTFNSHSINQKEKFHNSYILLEGGRNFLKYAKKVCNDINAKYLIVDKKQKRFFHITSVFASNYLVTYFDLIFNNYLTKYFSNKKIFNVLKPLILSTIDNIDLSDNFYDALSGPIERGDFNTIRRHLQDLKVTNKELYKLYKFFGHKTIKLALKKKSINKHKAIKIENLFDYNE